MMYVYNTYAMYKNVEIENLCLCSRYGKKQKKRKLLK